MEELLASQSQKITTLSRGQQVEGIVVALTDKEITLDLGTKSEGVLGKRDLPDAKFRDLKVGDQLKAYVFTVENEHGQVVLSLERQTAHLRGGSFRGGKSVDWSRFIQAQNHQSKLQGKVTEVNKGGLIVEVSGVRGFLPNSQVGFDLLASLKIGLETLIGQIINVIVTEVDLENNRLIFSQRGQVSADVLEKVKKFKTSSKVKGKIVAILPFGLVVDLDGVEGLIFISDVSWEKIDDLGSKFEVGQEVEAQVLGIDEDLGRVNLSIKHLTEDPFSKVAQNYKPDDVVKGQISGVTEAGITVQLDGAEGFLPASKMDPDTKYEVGSEMSFLVDSTDANKRRINLAPFVTSTAGLIYK